MARPPADPPISDTDPADVSGLAYRDAVVELERILVDLEDDAVDIDELSRRVRRAAALIRLCRDRIDGARIEVEQVVADLTRADLPAGAGDTPPAIDAPVEDDDDDPR